MGKVGRTNSGRLVVVVVLVSLEPKAHHKAGAGPWLNQEGGLGCYCQKTPRQPQGGFAQRRCPCLHPQDPASEALQRRPQEKEGYRQRQGSMLTLITVDSRHVLSAASMSRLVPCFLRQAQWVKPHYTKVYTIKLPDRRRLRVKSGTQVIDRFWGTLRSFLKNSSRVPGSRQLVRKIRSARNSNMWKATGRMIHSLFQIN